MKKFMAVVLFVSSTLLAQATPGVSAPADPYAAKARATLDLMIKTLGGDAYLSYQSKTEEGRTYSFYQGQPRGQVILYWRLWKYPDKDRTELTKQRDISYLIAGDAGYEITFRGTAMMDAEMLADSLRRREHSMEIVLREWLKDPQTVVLPSGTGVVEQKLCDMVTVIDPHNESVTIAIDQMSHLPIQKTFTYRDKDRYKVEDAEVFANYRVQQGVMTPFTWTRKKDGLMISQRFINTVEYNAVIPDAKFQAAITYDPTQLPPRKK